MNSVNFVKIVLAIEILCLSFAQGVKMSHKHNTEPEDVDSDENHRIEVTHRGDLINSTKTPKGHHTLITVTVWAFNDSFSIDLKLNSLLFSANYVERTFDENGAPVIRKVDPIEDNCFYLGTVRDRASSSAAVSTCEGIVGYFAVGDVTYHINSNTDQLHGPHKVYRSRRNVKSIYRCGHEDDHHDSPTNVTFSTKRSRRLKRSFNWPQDLDKENKVLELYVAVDHSMFLKYGSVDEVTKRVKEVINAANAGFQSIGIYLVLVGMEVWNTSDKMTFDLTNKNVTLANWATYRKLNINPTINNDHAILFTNYTFDNGVTIGYAYVNRTCAALYSASFVSDVVPSVASLGALVDHEIGHNFGLKHDDAFNPCPCSDPNGKCIMNSTIDTTTGSSTTWSQCSVDQLNVAYQQGRDLCMYNVPNMIDPSLSFCGNGIVESGEQCDCGNSTSVQCNRACCNSTTCLLKDGATCAYGRCCNVDTCQTLPCGTTCRAASSSCDLTEFCDGVGSLCPSDTYVPDGSTCVASGAAAYCYQGQCRNHQSQCELIWGPGTKVSVNFCYDNNKGGIYYAYCGVNWLTSPVSFIACPISDIMCGLLQCQDLTKTLYTYKTSYLVGSQTNTNGFDTCHSVTFDFGLATQSPGLVPNGAQCGTGMMCVNQKCVSASSVLTTSCNPACSSTQVCNNLGQCQNTTTVCSSTTAPPLTTTAAASTATTTAQMSSSLSSSPPSSGTTSNAVSSSLSPSPSSSSSSSIQGTGITSGPGLTASIIAITTPSDVAISATSNVAISTPPNVAISTPSDVAISASSSAAAASSSTLIGQDLSSSNIQTPSSSSIVGITSSASTKGPTTAATVTTARPTTAAVTALDDGNIKWISLGLGLGLAGAMAASSLMFCLCCYPSFFAACCQFCLPLAARAAATPAAEPAAEGIGATLASIPMPPEPPPMRAPLRWAPAADNYNTNNYVTNNYYFGGSPRRDLTGRGRPMSDADRYRYRLYP